MSKLKENLIAIQAEKEKIQANEIIKGKTLFGIEGTLNKLDSDEMGSIPTHDNGFGSQSSLSYDENYISVPLGNGESMNPNDDSLLLKAPNQLHGVGGFSAKIMIKMLFQHIGLTADKLLKGTNLFGLEGTVQEGVDTSDANAISKDILSGKTAYVNGEKITGTLSAAQGTEFVSMSNDNTSVENDSLRNSNLSIRIKDIGTANLPMVLSKNAWLRLSVPKSSIANSIGLTSEKIVKGNTILDVEGTGETNIPFEDETEYAECLSLANSILGITDEVAE